MSGLTPTPTPAIIWQPHSAKRWESACGHYTRTVAHGVAGSVYDAWFHAGKPDFEHVGYSKDPEQLDRLVTFHAERKQLLPLLPTSPATPTTPEESA